jgi:hypothetical protein
MVRSREEEGATGGKRARLAQAPAPAQDQGQTTALVPVLPPFKRTSTSTSTRAAAAAAAGAVGSTRELVERVLGFLAGGSRGARGDVGRAASVCRLWREVAYGEEVWGRMAAEVLPMLRGERDGRGYVAEQGRCLVERRVWFAEEWWEGLRLHLEVWDARDNLRILSAEGELNVRLDEDDELTLRIRGSDRREVVGPAFSAASRDPEHHRFATMQHYFDRAHDTDLPCAVCIRAVVSDTRTGRQALLFESGKERMFFVRSYDPNLDVIIENLPDGSICFGTDHEQEFFSTAWGPPPSGQGDPEALVQYLVFYLRPEEGQEGVPERDRLYRAVGGDEELYRE